ncbi:MAG: dockerin type I domain-containing protein, partial [Clostridium sp.]
KFIDKNKEAELVAPKLDQNTTTTIKSYFDSKLKKPTETSNPISYPSNTIEGDAEFNKNLEILTKAKVDKLISNKVLELKDSGEIILKDKAQYNRGILELNKEISSYTSKYYAKEDVNKDGTVDSLDLTLVAQFYNTVKTDKGYLEKADINKDGIIDVYDLVAISNRI